MTHNLHKKHELLNSGTLHKIQLDFLPKSIRHLGSKSHFISDARFKLQFSVLFFISCDRLICYLSTHEQVNWST